MSDTLWLDHIFAAPRLILLRAAKKIYKMKCKFRDCWNCCPSSATFLLAGENSPDKYSRAIYICSEEFYSKIFINFQTKPQEIIFCYSPRFFVRKMYMKSRNTVKNILYFLIFGSVLIQKIRHLETWNFVCFYNASLTPDSTAYNHWFCVRIHQHHVDEDMLLFFVNVTVFP